MCVMLKRIIGGGLALLLTTGIAVAQVSGVQVFTLPNTGGSSQWVKLGTYNANQQGYDIDVKIVTSLGYNAITGQDQVSYVHFKSSNAVSVDANGFAGDSWWYQTGPNTGAPSQVVWVANTAGTSATAFTLFAYFGPYTGANSFYVVDAPEGTTWTNSAVAGQTNPGSGSSTVLVAQNQFYVGSTSSFAGNVGIGTTNPSYALDVTGQIHATQAINASGGVTFPDGTTQSTAFNSTLCGGDFAESVDVTGKRATYEPGDVLVIDPDVPGKFLKSAEPYSTSVLGIYSTRPGTVGRRQMTPKSPDEVPMAMVGIVPTKVTAENGPIRPGDLLVTASIPGYAMRGTDRSRMLGAVIGKALGSLDHGTGVIEVGVTLQ
jgi:hypothetical protein